MNEEDLIEEALGPLTEQDLSERSETLQTEVDLWLQISDLLRECEQERKRKKKRK